ncbi:MAG: hypothetical protein V7L01_03075 [Nostoc sp.]|uniref:hypothetical protein n=1 Tax=Nostoc sp. TaxID=1180 RepID=UPI002FFC6FFF
MTTSNQMMYIYYEANSHNSLHKFLALPLQSLNFLAWHSIESNSTYLNPNNQTVTLGMTAHLPP